MWNWENGASALPWVNTHTATINYNKWCQQPQSAFSRPMEEAPALMFPFSFLSLFIPSHPSPPHHCLTSVLIRSQLDHCESLPQVFPKCSEMTSPLRAALFSFLSFFVPTSLNAQLLWKFLFLLQLLQTTTTKQYIVERASSQYTFSISLPIVSSQDLN